jgi:hypothetical protein
LAIVYPQEVDGSWYSSLRGSNQTLAKIGPVGTTYGSLVFAARPPILAVKAIARQPMNFMKGRQRLEKRNPKRIPDRIC